MTCLCTITPAHTRRSVQLSDPSWSSSVEPSDGHCGPGCCRPSGSICRGSNSESFAICGCGSRSEEHTSELHSRFDLVCRLLLEKKKYRPHRCDSPSRNI